MTDEEWISYLSGSSDPDDQSLVARVRLVKELQAKPVLTQQEAQFLALAGPVNRRELDYIKLPTAAKLEQDGRPCWPRWRWWPLLSSVNVATRPINSIHGE